MQSIKLCQTLLLSFICFKIHTHSNSTSRLSPCGNCEKLLLTPQGGCGAYEIRVCEMRRRVLFPESMGTATACRHGDRCWGALHRPYLPPTPGAAVFQNKRSWLELRSVVHLGPWDHHLLEPIFIVVVETKNILISQFCLFDFEVFMSIL